MTGGYWFVSGFSPPVSANGTAGHAFPTSALTASSASGGRPAVPPGDVGTRKQVFVKRILPICGSPDPSSCVRCPLAGVDLKRYIRPTHEETFASLRDQGLIDPDSRARCTPGTRV